MKMSTRAIHVGNEPDQSTGSVTPPIFQTSTFAQQEPGKHLGYEYSRSHNPTRTRLESCLASLEFAKYCITTSSGLSAQTLILHQLPKGSRILCGDDVYGGTFRLFTKVFGNIHQFQFVDTTQPKKIGHIIKKFKPHLVWLETPTNPLLKITPIAELANQCKKLNPNVLICVDNTFMSPYFQNPLNLGADIVLHSLTKYINGHSDVVGGAIMTNNPKLHQDYFYLQNAMGPCASPFDSWLVLRGVKTLAVRMKAHQENAVQIATYLSKHPKIEKVCYPGLKSHPQHQIARSQMSGFGGMITFWCNGGLKGAKKILSKVKLFTLAESLGGVESLIEHPGIMTHASLGQAVRKKIGISDNLIRISVGIEDPEDLIADLANALK